MSSIVFGVAASHSTLMNTHWNQLVHLDRAERFRDGLARARAALAAARPDAVIIIGPNHFRGMFLDLMPAFTIGIGECIASGESGTPGGPQKTDIGLARHIADHMIEASIDVAFSAHLQVDHGIMHAAQYLLAGMDIPIVPIIINVFAPPLPLLSRCHKLGKELHNAIVGLAGERRIAIIASGGLSHHLPWPDWRRPGDDDERFMVEAWLKGRGRWKDYEVRRREIVMRASASPEALDGISPDFDRAFLKAWMSDDLQHYLDMSTDELHCQAGNGGQEIRTWIAAKAAVGPALPHLLAYEAIPEWLTGMAVATLEPDSSTSSGSGIGHRAER